MTTLCGSFFFSSFSQVNCTEGVFDWDVFLICIKGLQIEGVQILKPIGANKQTLLIKSSHSE